MPAVRRGRRQPGVPAAGVPGRSLAAARQIADGGPAPVGADPDTAFRRTGLVCSGWDAVAVDQCCLARGLRLGLRRPRALGLWTQ